MIFINVSVIYVELLFELMYADWKFPFDRKMEKLQKKTHESINNRLALVMKSGKFTLGYKTVLKTLRNSKGFIFVSYLYAFVFWRFHFYSLGLSWWQVNWYWYLTIAHHWGSPRLSTMQCLLKLVFIITMGVSFFPLFELGLFIFTEKVIICWIPIDESSFQFFCICIIRFSWLWLLFINWLKAELFMSFAS